MRRYCGCFFNGVPSELTVGVQCRLRYIAMTGHFPQIQGSDPRSEDLHSQLVLARLHFTRVSQCCNILVGEKFAIDQFDKLREYCVFTPCAKKARIA